MSLCLRPVPLQLALSSVPACCPCNRVPNGCVLLGFPSVYIGVSMIATDWGRSHCHFLQSVSLQAVHCQLLRMDDSRGELPVSFTQCRHRLHLEDRLDSAAQAEVLEVLGLHGARCSIAVDTEAPVCLLTQAANSVFISSTEGECSEHHCRQSKMWSEQSYDSEADEATEDQQCDSEPTAIDSLVIPGETCDIATDRAYKSCTFPITPSAA